MTEYFVNSRSLFFLSTLSLLEGSSNFLIYMEIKYILVSWFHVVTNHDSLPKVTAVPARYKSILIYYLNYLLSTTDGITGNVNLNRGKDE